MNYQLLKTEINTDELARGYAGMTDQQVADSLNAVDRQRNRTSMSRQEIYENIDVTALSGLTAIQVAQLNLAMSDSVDPFGNAAQVFINIFGGGSNTVSALAAARVETVSRAVEIGVGEVIPYDLTRLRAV